MHTSTPTRASAHWDAVYQQHGHPDGRLAGVSWTAPHLEKSLYWIAQLTVGDTAAPVIDVGTGESTLADDLLARGYRALTLLDLSATALGHLRTRLQARFGEAVCDGLDWQVGDVTEVALPQAGFAVWHDRAVLHFLTERAQRAAYVTQATRCVRPGGGLVVAVFAPDGPQQCSQLDVQRYSADDLGALFAPGFEPVAAEREIHTTPGGASQEFQYWVGRRR